MGRVTQAEPRSRPTSPDPVILAQANERATAILGWSDGDIGWRVADRIERARSTIFRLEAVGAPGPAEAYYKVSHSPIDSSPRRMRWESTVSDGLARAQLLDGKLAELIGDEPIAFSRTLAADPGTLTLVTLALAGDPVGKVSRHLLPAERRQRLIEAFGLAGHAARLIEECSPGSVVADRDTFSRAIDRRLERARPVLPGPVFEALERRMVSLDEEVLSDPGALVYAHGDFSSSNVMLRDEGIGLIDFTWPPRLRGFDVAHFAFRVSYETGAPRLWTDSLVASLLDGYGDAGLAGSDNWQAVRIPRLLKLIELGSGQGSSRHRRSAKRALTEIEELL
jgi:Phosphotransferase enzyme family